MASTIVITAGVNILPPNDEQVPHLCESIITALKDPDTLTIAVQCCRSIVMTNPKTACDQEIIRYLLPRLINFVVSDEKDPDNAKSAVCGILTGFTSVLFGEQVQIAMALFVPTLLKRAAKDPSKSRESAARLLELAQADQQAFRAVVGGLQQEQRAFMEEVFRSNVGGQEKARPESAQPSIELKMNFGT
jgi:hypothetical protein